MVRISRFGPVTRFDVARTVAGRGRYWTTCYHVGHTLIDTGCAHAAAEFVAAVADLPIDRVLNTHSHEDHIGANGPLQRARPGLEVRAHPDALPVLAGPRHRQPLQPYRRLMWGYPDTSVGQSVRDGETLDDGAYRFLAIHTPGHAPDHLCFVVPEEGWLFSGDLYVGGRDRALRRDYDVATIIGSLKRVSQLSVGILFPGSARVRSDGHVALDEKIRSLEEARRRVIELDRAGRSERAIARALFGPPMLIEAITLGHFSRLALVRSCLGRFDGARGGQESTRSAG